MLMLEMRSRQGVAGLVSVLAIVMVFGIAATALLQITSQQASFAGSSSKITSIQRERLVENLQVNVVNCTGYIPSKGLANVTLSVENMGNLESVLDSSIFYNSSSNIVTDSKYLNETFKEIQPLESENIIITARINITSTDFANRVLLSSQLANRFIDAFDFTGCTS